MNTGKYPTLLSVLWRRKTWNNGEYSREDIAERPDDGLCGEGERLRTLLGPVQHLEESRVPVALQMSQAHFQQLGDLQGTAVRDFQTLTSLL